MSLPTTPAPQPAASPSPGGEAMPTVPDSVNDLFDLAAPPVEAPAVARLLPMPGATAASVELVTIALLQDQGTVTIGRSKELRPPFRIDGVPRLSGMHCEVTVDPVTLRVSLKDTSANGVFVNDVRVAKGEVVALNAGDTVALTKPPAPGIAPSAAEPHIAFIFQRLKAETDGKAMVSELTCGICMQVYHRPVSNLPCMHVFCAACTSRWLREGKTTCAECRALIREVRPTHKIQSCVAQLLQADPTLRRPAAELHDMDAADDIPPAGKVLGKRGREESDDDGSRSPSRADSSASSDGSDDSANVFGWAGDRVLAPGVHYGARAPSHQHPQAACPQCSHRSTLPDGFQCVPGGPHLNCQGCRQLFPERPLCGRPQRCHLCRAPYCGLYFGVESTQDAAGEPSGMPTGCAAEQAGDPQSRCMQPLSQWTMTVIPPTTFGGNALEISILTTYLAAKGILPSAAWQTCVEKLAEGSWKPDLPSIGGPLTPDSAVCVHCATQVFAAQLFHYRRAIPREELPEAVTNRSNCWYGMNCRTQFHKPQHAQSYNHVCYQEKRKE